MFDFCAFTSFEIYPCVLADTMDQNDLVKALRFYMEQVFSDLQNLSQNDPQRWRNGLQDIKSWDKNIVMQELDSLHEIKPDFEDAVSNYARFSVDLPDLVQKFMLLCSMNSAIVDREYWTYNLSDRAKFVDDILVLSLRALAPKKQPHAPELSEAMVSADDSISQTADLVSQASRASAFPNASKVSMASRRSSTSKASKAFAEPDYQSKVSVASSANSHVSRRRRESRESRDMRTTEIPSSVDEYKELDVDYPATATDLFVGDMDSAIRRLGTMPVINDDQTGMED
jgi:hypothetical protein